MDNFLGTQTFRIIEAQESIFQYGREHYVRISIPGIEVHYRRKVGYFLKIDIINAVYQYMLYDKKGIDSNKIEVMNMDDFDHCIVAEHNKVCEEQLTRFWEYAIETLGGKIIENQNQKNNTKSFIFAVVAILISITSLLITVIGMIK